jgi:cell filamentation protein
LTDVVDPYVDPETGVLRNLIGATTGAALATAEADLTAFAAIELAEHPVKVTRDLRQLRNIHHRLFRDLFEWAGELRTVDMRKAGDATAEFFMPASRVDSGGGFAFRELADDDYLRGLDRDLFILRLAHHYDQVNYLHPFREGNGRTQRIFWSQIARAAGFELNWCGVSGATNDRACRLAMETQDLSELCAMFETITHR